jgi:transposase
MRKVRDVLRLKAVGLGKRKIAASLGISATAVGGCLRRAREAGVAWPLAEEMTDEALEARLYPASVALAEVAARRPLPDWPTIHRELKRPGVTLQLLWGEHRAAHPDGYGYSRFCDLYRAWEKRLSPTMRQTHVAGEKLFVDYAGTTMQVIDGATGEVIEVQLFVAVLGASSYTYAEATWTQGLADWIGSHTRTFAFIGGVPGMVVSDNLKAGITKACFYEPAVNRTYAEMAAHYDTAIVPARPYKPRDKAKVEVAVLVATRWIIAKLRKRTFFSLAELNAAISIEVAALNARVTRHLGASRKALFEELECPALKSLPHTCAPRRTASTRRCASTCRRAIGATPTGRRNTSGGAPARSGPTRRRSLQSSCASVRTPSRASVPRLALSGSPTPTAAIGWRRPAAGRSRSARAPTRASTRS